MKDREALGLAWLPRYAIRLVGSCQDEVLREGLRGLA